MVKIIIEIPKGSLRRIHFNKAKNEFVDLGPTKDQIPLNNGMMPIDYGFIPDTFNPNDNDDLDVLVLSNKKLKTGDKLDVLPIALIKRDDGDDKIVAADDSIEEKTWDEISDKLKSTVLSLFSYKSKITSIENKSFAERYIKSLAIT